MAQSEQRFDFIERWRYALAFIPAFLFVIVAGYVLVDLFNLFGENTRLRGYPTSCAIEVEFEGVLADGEKREINKQVSSRICDHFGEVGALKVSRDDVESPVQVAVDLPEWMLDYDFVRKSGEYRIRKYVRNLNSDEKPRKVQRDTRSAQRLVRGA